MYQDDCRLKGVVNLVLRDKNGKVKQHKTIRNKVTDYGVAHILQRLVDDRQDREGSHQMPRMMSHMAIGIGAAARSGPHRYNASDFDDPAGNGSAARRRAATASTHDRMLQDERGERVQLMKDTTKTGDYAVLTGAVLNQASSAVMIQTISAKTVLVFNTTSANSGADATVKKLRVGLRINGIGESTETTAQRDIISDNLTITSIESGTPTSTATSVTLSGTLNSTRATALASVTGLVIDVEYVGQAGAGASTLTTYSNSFPHPTHQIAEPMNLNTTKGPFNTVGTQDGVTNSDFNEDGKALLGVLRGRIGAFYEREIEVDTDLVGSTAALTALGYPTEKPDEAGYAKLDSGVARFPFLGDAAAAPAGSAAGANNNPPATQFVQFGTAVDGIFHGALVGSSLVEDKGTAAEGTPHSEHNFGGIGGLGDLGGLVISGRGVRQTAQFVAASNRIKYAPSGTAYDPNALKGAKKHGNRIVYVATFKENNPRPETDYDVFGTSWPANLRNPGDRVYPITEAGIFNKHKPDIGIFDIDASLPYTAADANPADLQHIDRRVVAPFSGTEFNFGTGTTPAVIGVGEEKAVLTSQAETVTVGGKGFTQGPITQSMLCRTTFDPVNKATADTLQITWSVQLEDATQ